MSRHVNWFSGQLAIHTWVTQLIGGQWPAERERERERDKNRQVVRREKTQRNNRLTEIETQRDSKHKLV